MTAFINRFGGAGGMVGQGSIDRALASGMTINQIRSALANEGIGTGAKATSSVSCCKTSIDHLFHNMVAHETKLLQDLRRLHVRWAAVCLSKIFKNKRRRRCCIRITQHSSS